MSVGGAQSGRIGRYVVLDVIGSGGFATVYRAHDPALDSVVAIKVLAENWTQDANIRARFIREARLLRRLDSDRLVTVHDINETDNGQPFIVMSLAPRGTVEDLIEGRTGDPALLPESDVRFVITELAEGLAIVHAGGVIHRDVKPSNLLITKTRGAPNPSVEVFEPDDRIILGDFGLARDLDSLGSTASMFGGTPGFMAPEQMVTNAGVDHRCDIYAATALVLYLVTGEMARWDGRYGPPALPRLDELALAPALKASIESGLHAEPEQRPATMQEWRDRLLDGLDARDPMSRTESYSTAPLPGPVTPIPTPPPGPPSGPPPAAAAGTPTPPPGPPPASVSSPPAERAASGLRKGVAIIALVVVVIVAGALGLNYLAGLLEGGVDVSIDGPDTSEAGDTVRLEADAPEDASLTWTLPDGTTDFENPLVFEATTAGEIEVKLEVETLDGDTGNATKQIEVAPGEDSPMIDGPDELRVGEEGRYEASAGDDAVITWIDPNDQPIDGDVLIIEPTTTGRVTFTAIATYPDSRELATRMEVHVVE